MGKKKQIPGKRDETTDACDDVFKLVFDNIQTGIFIIEPETHTIIDVNPIAESLIGLTKDQLIGKTCHDFVCPAHCGECPITDLHKTIANTERILINAKGEKVPILKTVAKASMQGNEYLIESFVDILDRKKAEDRKVALIAYLNEAVVRVEKPLELTAQNLEVLAKSTASGEADTEDIRMQLQIQANNISRMVATLRDLTTKVAQERDEIPQEFREFFIGK